MTGTVRDQACGDARARAGTVISTPACFSILHTPDAERCPPGGDLAQAQLFALEGHDAGLCAGIAHGPAEPLALGARWPARGGALDDHLALELGERSDNMEK